ncbi:MAG: hypothetical protein GF320_05330 [Armatimonadia bacterium]|nr:hypothetical protein [Armatimonadia bacterium]
MIEDITPDDRSYLRDLANRQAEYAALPVMAERESMWRGVNAGSPSARPPVIIEAWTFNRDFMPAGTLLCSPGLARGIEHQLVRNIRQHELIGDDHVMPDHFQVGWHLRMEPYGGLRVDRTTVEDSQGVATGYRWDHPIKDLRSDLKKLKPVTCAVDREGTHAFRDLLDDLLGDILPVRLVSGMPGNRMLTHAVVELMGMEAYFMAMYDCPDELHQLMAYLRDNALAVGAWMESEGLLIPNNGNDVSFGSSFNFTDELPRPGRPPEPIESADMWGSANSQETVGVSPELFHEFCYPYYRDVCEPLGLVYYGCCEPVHPFWDDLRDLPNLRKVSISKWCDETFMANALRGTGMVYSRKPDPNFLSVDAELNEARWASHIRDTLRAADGVPLEIIVRDVYTVHGDLGNARRAVEVARRVIDEERG